MTKKAEYHKSKQDYSEWRRNDLETEVIIVTAKLKSNGDYKVSVKPGEDIPNDVVGLVEKASRVLFTKPVPVLHKPWVEEVTIKMKILK